MKRIFLAVAALLVTTSVAAALWLNFAPPAHVARVLLDLERGRSGLERKQVSIPGFHIAYLEGGRGETVMLLHGFGGDKDNWTRIARYLTPHMRVIAPDLPGFGDSDKPADARYRTRDQAERLHALVQALGLESFHLGGNSMGGRIAAEYAAAHPDRVRTLWLLAPAGVASAEPSEMLRRLPETARVPLLARTTKEFGELIALVTADPPYVPGALKRVYAARGAASYELHRRIFFEIGDEWRERPLENVVARLPTPTRLVWGRADRVLHVSGADVLQRTLPNASVLVLPEVGHLPMLEAPQPVAADYLAFLQTVRRQAARSQ